MEIRHESINKIEDTMWDVAASLPIAAAVFSAHTLITNPSNFWGVLDFLPGGRAARRAAGAVDAAGNAGAVAARQTSRVSVDDLIKSAQQKYPGKAGRIEHHHIIPKYLGGNPKGPTVPIDAAYHQVITNEFRRQWGYGLAKPSNEDLVRIPNEVYSNCPLP